MSRRKKAVFPNGSVPEKKREFATMLHAQPATFFGAPLVSPGADELSARGARVGFLGVPWDEGNGGRNGANYGPRAARDASSWFLGHHFEADVDLFEAVGLVDCGDVPVVPSDSDTTMRLIETYVSRLLDAGMLPIIVGGNHSVTIGSFRAVAARFARVGYLAIDAHLDTARDLGGARFTSASPTARAAESDAVAPGKAIVVGIRGALNPSDQVGYAKELGVRIHPMSTIDESGADHVAQSALAEVMTDVEATYISFDLDSMDASVVPGTGTPEPGGLNSREALRIARRIGGTQPAAFDLVELAPAYDLSGITARLLCAIVVEFLRGYVESS